MKQYYLIAITLFIIAVPLHAKTLKQQMAKIEKKIDALAKSEHKAWREIARLNLEVDRLEKESNKTES